MESNEKRDVTTLFEISAERTRLLLQSNGLVIAEFKNEKHEFSQQVQITGTLFRSFVAGCREHGGL